MNTEVRMLKLTNGEDIISLVDTTKADQYHLINPLLMRVQVRTTDTGIQEGLHLSRWLQPFCESKSFSIDKKHVVLSTEVTSGLTKYYEYSLKSFERDENQPKLASPLQPTEEELEEIEIEEIEEEFEALEPISKTIH